VAVGNETEENLPKSKSKSSRRNLPPPADLASALRALKTLQKAECLALSIPVHIVAAWHGHDPAVSLSIYSPRI